MALGSNAREDNGGGFGVDGVSVVQEYNVPYMVVKAKISIGSINNVFLNCMCVSFCLKVVLRVRIKIYIYK